MQRNYEFLFLELKQNQKDYKHKNLVNGESRMRFKHIVAHICSAKLKIQNQRAAKTCQSEISFQLNDNASERRTGHREGIMPPTQCSY
jgi:hypothetical protein